jgi:uncharacterized protein YqjF (DUF2071 family)
MNPKQLLAETHHRPWPLPDAPWVMAQTWYDLLFAHWPIPADVMRAHVPPQLELDTFDGLAWLGVVPFGMTRVYPRRAMPVPWLSHFLEINVRTYVTLEGKPGVYFFSLDAANPLVVEIARRWYQLPYYRARMSRKTSGDFILYHSYRTHRGAAPAELEARYQPIGPVYLSQPGSLEAWLTERYCLYLVKNGQVYRGEIHHPPWPLQRAEVEMAANTMAASHGLQLPDTPPLHHFARRIDTLEWPIAPVAKLTG